LHNHPSRVKICDGGVRLRGEFPLDELAGALWELDSGDMLLL
jgi:hypothetical protein